MKSGILPLWMVFLCAAACGGETLPAPVENVLELVDPRIGTGGRYFGYASAFAGACVPHGLAKPGPDTSGPYGAETFHHFSGYHAEDDLVLGFSQLHISGTGAPDYGVLALLPTLSAGERPWREDERRSQFDKTTEVLEPGYWAATLLPSGIRVELTASERCAVHRYTFPASSQSAEVIVDAGHALNGCSVTSSSLTLNAGAGEISGEILYHGALTGRSGGVPVYFVMKFPAPLSHWKTWTDGVLADDTPSAAGTLCGAVVRVPAGAPVEIRMGLSAVDLPGARHNLESELSGLDFDAVRAAARQRWRRELERVRIAGGSREEQVKFYTALYHVLLTPTLFTDSDGRYRGFDNLVHHSEDFTYYTDFSLWDTYRTAHPLFAFLFPERQRDFTLTLLDMGRRLGRLPRWPAGVGDSGSMVGTPAEIVIADSYLRGVRGYDAAEALGLLLADATSAPPGGGREGFARYRDLGWLPADEFSGAAAKTLEFALADAAVAHLGAALGRSDVEAEFAGRARNFRNLYHAESGFLRGRNSDGSWYEPFNPLDWDEEDYVEGTAWQYLWLAPQDPEGLAELLGGKDAAAEKLETFFTTPEPEDPLKEFLPKIYYWHGNEPDLHAAYLFNHFERPEKTQFYVRQILAELYGTGPDGLAGNDDCGTLSAWYVLSAAGLYPFAGTGGWELSSPLFERVIFEPAGKDVFEIRARGASAERWRVGSVWLDGRRLENYRLTAEQLLRAKLLEFEMIE